MKSIISIIIASSLLASCAKVDDVIADRKDPNFGKDSDEFRVSQEYNSLAESVAIYFMPKYEDITWDSTLFSKNASEDEKLSTIAKEVAYNGLYVDHIIGDQYKVSKGIVDLEEQVETLIEDTDYFDCEEVVEDEEADADLSSQCETLLEGIESLEGKQFQLREKFNSLVKNIQMALDGKTKGTKNWIETESTQSELVVSEDINEPVSLKVTASFIPNQPWTYKSSEGDIFDLEQVADFGGKLIRLNFSIKERTKSGDYTGRFYKASLNRSFLDGIGVRFLGSIKMYDQFRPDYVLREGNMKIILLLDE